LKKNSTLVFFLILHFKDCFFFFILYGQNETSLNFEGNDFIWVVGGIYGTHKHDTKVHLIGDCMAYTKQIMIIIKNLKKRSEEY